MHIRYKLYPVTFGNDDKSHQNKSHNEITVQLWEKVAKFSGLKVKYTGSILTWVRMIDSTGSIVK